MTPMDRLSYDPTVPASLRDALQKAGDEKAPRDALNRVLGVSAVSAGAATIAVKAAARGSLHAPALLRASVAAKGMAAVAIFVAGGVVGGYAVHEHDVQQAPLALRPQTPAQVLRAPLASPVEREREQPASHEQSPLEAAPVGAPAVVAGVASVAAPAAAAVAAAPPPRPHGSLDVGSPVESRTPALQASPTPPDASSSPSLAPVAPSWREELAGLRAIRDEVTSNRGGDAIAAIAACRGRFPAPVFEQELLFLEAQARLTRGDPEACLVLDHFATIYPTSLLLPRARALRTTAKCP